MNELGKSLLEPSLGNSWGGIALLFLGFLYFFLAALGYGHALRRALFPRGSLLAAAGDSFLFASLFLAATAFLLAAAHGLAWFPRWAYWLFFLPGLLLALPLGVDLAQSTRARWRWPALVFLLVFFVRALTAALPAQHGDPLLYHLLGPRLWTEAGGFLMHPNLPNALLASSWECLYVWPQLFFFSSQPFYGLVEAQLYSQWLHLFLAWGGSALLVMRLFRGSVKEKFLPLLGLAALFVAGVQWTAPLAKNDAGIAFWTLGSLVFFLEAWRERRLRSALFSGVFAGLAVSGKITALLSLAPLLGLSFFAYRPWKEVRFAASLVLLWLFGFALGALPIYVRNFLLSQNPFFPLFPRLFPSPWVSHSWGAHFSQVSPSSPLHAFPRLATRAGELLRESPWIAGALLFLPLRRAPRVLLAGAFLAYAIFVLTQAPEIELRYLGASLEILAAGGVVFFLRLAARLKPRGEKIAAALLLVALLATSKLPLHVLRKIWASPLGTEFIRTHSAGEAKAWVRAHAAGGFTVVAGDNETYYLTPVGVAVLTERPDFDAALAEKDFPRFLTTLCRLSHARFLLDARPAIGVEALFGAQVLAPAKVFSAQGANVYDLRALEASIPGAEKNCQ